MCSDNENYAVVAGDELVARAEARHILKRAGFHVFEAANLQEARAILDQHGSMVELLFLGLATQHGELYGAQFASYCGEELPHVQILIASQLAILSQNLFPEHAVFISGRLSYEVVTKLFQSTTPSPTNLPSLVLSGNFVDG